MKRYDKNQLKNLKHLCCFLIIVWITIKIVKNIMNHDGIVRYSFIQENTVGYWLLFALSFYLSKLYYNTLSYTPLFFISIFLLHEVLWYGLPLMNIGSLSNITKDEGEVTNNMYLWFNRYTDNLVDIKKKNVENRTDFSEGIFDNNWNMSNEEAMENKYRTYFNYLKLQSGMKLLDIGCGNCFWLEYCKKRGVICTGITITEDQVEVCNANGHKDIILGNITKEVLKKVEGKFDAITAIGPLEHFTSISNTSYQIENFLNDYYNDVINLIDKNSSSRRYLNSVMNTNMDYSKYHTLEWFFHIYLIATSYGYGYYPLIGKDYKELENIYTRPNTKFVVTRDYTEDYRWIFAKNKNSIGFCKYNFKTVPRIINFIGDVLTDPGWYGRLLYGINNSWLWQFGGTKEKPDPNNKDVPVRAIIYVIEIN